MTYFWFYYPRPSAKSFLAEHQRTIRKSMGLRGVRMPAAFGRWVAEMRRLPRFFIFTMTPFARWHKQYQTGGWDLVASEWLAGRRSRG